MTLAAVAPLIDYLENGVSTTHAVPFQFQESTDLAVTRISPLGVAAAALLGADYTVAGGAGETGSVTMAVAKAAGWTLRIARATARTQPANYTPGDNFPAETLERGLDRTMAVAQEIEAALGDLDARALKVPAGEVAPPLDLADFAGGAIGVSAGGDAFVPLTLDGDGGVSALATLAASAGASLIGWIRAGVGAAAMTIASWFDDQHVNIREFGASRAGSAAANTTALAAAIAHAALKGLDVYVPWGRFEVTEVRTLNGMGKLYGPGWLVGTSATPEAVVTTNDLAAVDFVDEVEISVNIDCNEEARRGILLQKTRKSKIAGCKVRNLVPPINPGTGLPYNCDGIRVNFGCTDIEIDNNDVEVAFDEPFASYASLKGIHVVAETHNPTGGIDTAPNVPIYPAITTSGVRITNNRVVGGTHGIALFGAGDVLIALNRVTRSSHRNIIAGPTCVGFTIANNQCDAAGSAAIHVALGCKSFSITGNRCQGTALIPGNDGGALQVYLYCHDFVVSGNVVSGEWHYDFFGSHIFNGLISGNDFGGTDTYASIGIQSEWANPAPGGAIHTKNRGPLGYTAGTNTYNIALEGNNCRGGPAAVSLAQIGATKTLDRISIEGGTADAADDYVHVFEETTDKAINLSLANLMTPGDTSKYSFTRGRAHFRYISNVVGLDDEIHASATVDVGSIAANALGLVAITATGAAVGDYVEKVSVSTALEAGLAMLQAYVSAADTVTLPILNGTGAAIDPASRTYRAVVRKRVA